MAKIRIGSPQELEPEDTFWWRNYYYNHEGRHILVMRRHLFTLWADAVKLTVWNAWMMAKCKIAFKLLQGVGDPCPYCNYVINVGTWDKIDPRIKLKVERIDDARSDA